MVNGDWHNKKGTIKWDNRQRKKRKSVDVVCFFVFADGAP